MFFDAKTRPDLPIKSTVLPAAFLNLAFTVNCFVAASLGEVAPRARSAETSAVAKTLRIIFPFLECIERILATRNWICQENSDMYLLPEYHQYFQEQFSFCSELGLCCE